MAFRFLVTFSAGQSRVTPDDEFVADEVEMVKNVFEEPFWTIGIIVIRIVPDDDVRVCTIVLDERDPWESFHGMFQIRKRSMHACSLLIERPKGNLNRAGSYDENNLQQA